MTWRVQFDWFADFCGLEDDREALKLFLSATHLKLSAHLTVLQDEEAPVSVHNSTAVVGLRVSVPKFTAIVGLHVSVHKSTAAVVGLRVSVPKSTAIVGLHVSVHKSTAVVGYTSVFLHLLLLPAITLLHVHVYAFLRIIPSYCGGSCSNTCNFDHMVYGSEIDICYPSAGLFVAVPDRLFHRVFRARHRV